MKGMRLDYPEGSSIVHLYLKLKSGKWVSMTTGCRTKAEAKKEIPRVRKELLKKHGEEDTGGDEPVQNASPGKSFKEDFFESVEYHIERQKLRNPTPMRRGAHYITENLKQDAARPTKDQRPADWEKCRERLLDLVEAEELAARTLETYLKDARQVLKRYMVKKGLPEDCVAALEGLPLASMGSAEASGLPFSKAQLEVMLDLEPSQSDITRILMWLGASGALQAGDAAAFELAFVKDWETGHIRGRRVKTGEIYEFDALPPLLALLRKRRDELGPKAVFALPELIYTVADLKKAGCNTVPWKKIPADVVKAATNAAIGVVNKFLELCGIKSKDITQKSWRKLMISVWATLGLREKVRMRMAGQRTLEENIRYDTPAEFIFTRTKDVVWRMFCAIKERRPFFIPTTVFDVYDALHQDLDKLPETFRQMLVQELGGIHTKLDRALADNKALHLKVDQLLVTSQRLELKLAHANGSESHLPQLSGQQVLASPVNCS